MHRRSMAALVLTLLIAVLLLGCGDAALKAVPGNVLDGVPWPRPKATVVPQPEATAALAGASIAPTATNPLEGLVETRTPEPTATPGQIAREVEKAVARAGLASTRILGLTIADWTNLGTALLVAVLAYLAGTLLIRRILPPITQRTSSELDDQLLEQAGSHLRWLVVVITCDRAMQP